GPEPTRTLRPRQSPTTVPHNKFARSFFPSCKRSAYATIANDRIWRPEQRMGIGEFGLAVRTSVAGPVRQRHHGLPQRLAARQFRIVSLALEQIRDEFPR